MGNDGYVFAWPEVIQGMLAMFRCGQVWFWGAVSSSFVFGSTHFAVSFPLVMLDLYVFSFVASGYYLLVVQLKDVDCVFLIYLPEKLL